MDLASRRVFADELLERGDEWGEFIHLQCERGSKKQSPREYELEWKVMNERLKQALGPSLKSFHWKHGFLEGIEFDVDDGPFEELRVLAERPEAKLLQRLIFNALAWDGAGDMTPIWAQLPSLPRLACLTTVKVDKGLDLGNPYIDGPIDIGDIGPLLVAYPRLEQLELFGFQTRFEQVDLPSLETFSAWSLNVARVPALAAARWPRLRSLDLHFVGIGRPQPEQVFPPLLAARMNEHLERVRISSPWPEYFRVSLPQSPLGRGRTIEIE